MRFHVESDLDFKLRIIEAVCDLFRGQEICRAEFTVPESTLDKFPVDGNDRGVGNQQNLPDEDILPDLKDILQLNCLPLSDITQFRGTSLSRWSWNGRDLRESSYDL